jgi:serine beta-lactamase-like protein LACTB
VRNEKGQLMNTPYVDNCYKWAGGGFISTTEDLIKFGNAMLYSSQIGEFQGKSKDSLLSGKSLYILYIIRT